MSSPSQTGPADVAAPYRFAIAASFTAEPIQRVLEFWGRQFNATVETRFAPYNQVMQTLLQPGSVFGSNAYGINIVLVRVDDLGHLDAADPASIKQTIDNATQLALAARDAHERFAVPLVFCLLPSSPRVAASFRDVVREVATRVEATLDGVPGVQCVSAEQIQKLYPVDRVDDPEGEALGQIPYTEAFFVALGTAIVRIAHSLTAPPYKVIALDCDNTLWQGICGEDGPTGVVLDPARRALHEFMLEQREAGMLLCLASKNNEPDVIETFELNPDFPLKMRHFTAWRLNWEPKAVNLAELASELSLGLDSFIFIDDNPRECGEVEDAEPEVLTLALPEDPAEIPHFLEHVWAFDHPVVTEEDRNRSAYYSQGRQFGKEARGARDIEQFMNGLALEVSFAPVSAGTLPRAAQMTQRTNQFNVTTIRRTEAEIRALAEQGSHCVTVDVSDRFGKYGITGLLIWREITGALDVDTFLLSCRVLGRGVEHRVLAHIAQTAIDRGLSAVRIRVEPTRKNQPARQFLHDVAVRFEQQAGPALQYQLPAAEYRELRWRPPVASASAPAKSKKREDTGRRFIEYGRIARHLSTPALILEAMRAETGNGHGRAAHGSTERRLAAIWSDLLRKTEIHPEDNFYDLGGHSLLAVLLTLRVREEFGIELPIDDVYSAGLTLNGLARKVEAYEFAHVSPEEYRALLAEIEAMTDDEVREALAREGAGGAA